MDKRQPGTLKKLTTVSVSQKGGRLSHPFSGTADVYVFTPDDPRCKVTHLALVNGIDHTVFCSQSGDVGAAVLAAAGLRSVAKNSGALADGYEYPDPVGCPDQRLRDRLPVQAIAFYRK